MRILLVENEQPTGSELAGMLTTHQLTVNLVTDKQTGFNLAEALEYDLILLNILTPELDGPILCQKLRSYGCKSPILLLTVPDQATGQMLGWNAGADDCVINTVSIDELISRIRALLKPRRPRVERQHSMPSQQQVAAKTAQIWMGFKDQFFEQLVVLEDAAVALMANHLSPGLHQQARQAAHRLAGSLGVFGFMEGSTLARKIEEFLKQQAGLELRANRRVIALVELLRLEMSKSPSPDAESKSTPYRPRVLIVDDDLAWAERVREEAIAWDLAVEIATDLNTAWTLMLQISPDAILLDLSFPGSHEDGLTLLEEIKQRIPKTPILAFTRRGSLRDRKEVANLGGDVFLHKPMPTHEILKVITDVLNEHQQTHSNRVMIVDDDITIPTYLSTLLQPLGVDVVGLDQPKQFWELLTTTAPNLLVLDLDMPDFNGVDLCRIVRNDPRWQHLPIVFFSSDTKASTVNRAFAVGADNYISKSSTGEELVNEIVHRLYRSGFQPSQASTAD
jgi:DNA-binding response OmpR family regulator